MASASPRRREEVMDEIAEYDLISGKFRLSVRKNFETLLC